MRSAIQERTTVFRDALQYLRNARKEALTTVLLGGLLTFFTFLIVPQIILLGYYVRVLRRTARGDEIPPTFGRWRELLIDGTKAYVIWFGWIVIPLLVRFGLNGGHLKPGQATFWLLGWMLPLNTLSFIQQGAATTDLLSRFAFSEPYVDLFIVLYLFPAALANFAEKGTIRSGFFEGGLKRYLDWILGLLRHVLPHLADLVQRVVDRVLSDSKFTPVSTFTNPQYTISWVGYFLFYLTGEAILRLFLHLPTFDGFSWINMIYLFGALLVYFYLRVTGWAIIGYTWSDVRPVEEDSSTVTGGERERENNDRQFQIRERQYAWPVRPEMKSIPAKTVLTGGLLLIFNIFVLPGILVGGYLIRVLQATRRDESVPLFSGMRELFSDGVKAYAIWFGYTLIPSTLLFSAVMQRIDAGSPLANLAGWGVVTGIGLPGGFPALILFMIGGIGLLLAQLLALSLLPSVALPVLVAVRTIPISIALALFVLSMYIVPAALLNFATTGSLRAGFALRSLTPTLRRGEYAARWAAAILLTLPGWATLLGTQLLITHPLFGDAPLVEPVAGLEYLTFFSLPTSLRALLFFILFLISGGIYFILLVASCRIIAQLEVDREQSTTSTDSSHHRDSEMEQSFSKTPRSPRR